MDLQTHYETRRQLLWGALLIGVGLAFMLDRMDMFDLSAVWQYWPLTIVVFGANRMLGFPTARHFVQGLWMVLFGLWLYAVSQREFGLTLHNSWPVVFIFWGVRLVLEPLIATHVGANKE